MKKTNTFVKIDGWGEMHLAYLIEMVKELKGRGNWTFDTWKPTAALIDKNGKASRQYVGQRYDPKYIDLVADGWNHDHCEFCTKTISNRDIDGWVKAGYRLDRAWICEECYNLFMKVPDIDAALEKYERVEK